MHWKECGQQIQGGDPAPLFSSSEATSGELFPVLGYRRSYWKGPNRGHKDDEEPGVSVLQGEIAGSEPG